jgi:hypothetical protein
MKTTKLIALITPAIRTLKIIKIESDQYMTASPKHWFVH